MEKPVIMEADSQAESCEVHLEKLNILEIRQQTDHILTTLLETGECDIDALFSMMKILSVHTSNLMLIKTKYEKRVTEAEKKLQEKTENVNLINKLFHSVKQPKVWDNFTIAQRKTIDSWIQEMEASDDNNTSLDMDDVSASKRIRLEHDMQTSMSNEIMELHEEGKMLLDKITEANEEKKELERILLMQKSRLQQLQADEEPSSSSENASTIRVTRKEMHLISLICIFLSAYPSGADVHCICSYLNQFNSTIQDRDVESLMKNFPSVFNEECIGIGATLEKKWHFRNFPSS